MRILVPLRTLLSCTLGAGLLTSCGGGDLPPAPGPDLNEPTVIGGPSGFQGRYGLALADPVSVVVQHLNTPLQGVEVTFTVTAGGGSVTGGTAVTNAMGIATVGSWTLGPAPGMNTLRASAGALQRFIDATATPGPPTTITITAGNNQTWVAGALVPFQPAVVVTDGQFPVPGREVAFTVVTGSGSVVRDHESTRENGLALAGGWRLGAAGINTLSATVVGSSIPPAIFTATAEPLAISAINKIAGDAQVGFAGNFAGKKPGLSVLNQFGKPAEGVAVVFNVTSGGGTIRGTVDTTDITGQAALASWRFGVGELQTVDATAGTAASVTFGAAVVPPPADFKINLIYPGGTPGITVRNALSRAAARWQALIVGGLPTITLAGNVGIGPVSLISNASGRADTIPCIPRVQNTTIKDVNIYAYVLPIDGASGSNILGFATPVYVRSGTNLPFAGCMVFDADNISEMETNGTLEDVLLHEMAHVFGFGTIWEDNKLLVDPCPASSTPSFNGSSAQQAFVAALPPGTAHGAPIVPVEGEGACHDGTRDSHWSEAVFGNELMTGYVQSGGNPLSAITAASLRDLGYTVNDAPSSPYTIPPAAALRTAMQSERLNEMQARLPLIATDGRGRTMQVLQR